MSDDRHVVGAVSVVEGAAARRLLQDTEFLTAWRRLHDASPGSSAFQRPEFAVTWFLNYEADFAPWLLIERTADGELNGLLALGCTGAGNLVAAGAHHAEYQGWLARIDNAVPFLEQAWSVIQAHLPGARLKLKYVPQVLAQAAASSRLRSIIEFVPRRRPLMRLHPDRIAESLRKKSNKSKLNRLARLGDVRLERLRTAAALDAHFNEIIVHYDLRQGATHGSRPFGSDAHKRAFHMALSNYPELLHVTVLWVGERLVAAHLGAISGDTVHLGIIAHSALYAEHSVGKLQLLLLARLLSEEGFETFDLTPGDDSWKERFADVHDEVYELHFYPSAAARTLAVGPRRLAALAKRGAGLFGITPHRLRDWFGRWLSHEIDVDTDITERWTRSAASATVTHSGAVGRDVLKDLLLEPLSSSGAREQFLRRALARLERGEHVYTAECNGKLRYSAWVRRVEGGSGDSGVILYDIQSYDTEAFEALLEQNVDMLARPTFVDVPVSATRAADVLRRLGFGRIAGVGTPEQQRLRS